MLIIGTCFAALIPESPKIIASPVQVNAGMPDVLISLDLRDIEISDALKFLAVKAGLSIIPTKKVLGKVTLMVENMPVKDVFDILMRSNSLAYDKKGSIFNVMTEDEYKAIYGKNFYDIRKVKIIRLKYMVPEQAYMFLDTLKSDIGKVLLDAESGTLMIMDTPDNIVKIEEALKLMEEKSAVRIFPIKYALAKDIETQLKKYLDTKKAGTVKADERVNQVIVQTLPDRMEEIAQIVEGLDKKTKQILIDARIIQVRITNSKSAGIELEGIFDVARQSGLNYLGTYPFSSIVSSSAAWKSRQETLDDTGYAGSYPFSGTTSTSNASQPKVIGDKMHVGVVGKQDFDVLINYLNTLGETKILSNPKLAVVNNQEAKIHVGEKQAYITTTTTQGQGTTTIAEQVTYVDVGVQLFVTPFINDDGFVTVKIKPEISSVLSYLDTSSGNKIPIIDTSAAETMVMVKDGSTLIIGGLTKEEVSTNQQSTPILGKMPIVGALFKNKTNGSVRNELLILLTPHIITGDELTTGYARDFGHKLDKEDQAYIPFEEEHDKLEGKHYQEYPQFEEKKSNQAVLKPLQEIN